MSSKEILVPDIGDFSDVDVIELLVSPGDTVAVDDALITLESDKASMDVPSSDAGTVKELKVGVGDKVSEGSVILVLETAGGAEASAPAPAADTPSPAAPADGGGVQEIKVPDIGDFSGVDVIEVLVSAGDTVAVDDALITLESDKASMDVPSPAAGKIKELKIKVGDKVSEGDLIMLLEGEGGAAAPAAPAPAAAPATSPAPAAPAAAAEAGVSFERAHASPSIRRQARERKIDLNQVKGTGRKGRITKEDLDAFEKGGAKAAAPAAAAAAGGGIPPIPAVDFSKFGEVETRPLTKIKRLTGINLSRAWLNVPHVTHNDEVDITETEAFRKALKDRAEQAGVRVTLLSFFMKACVAALKEFPSFNSSLDPSGENLILKKYFHIGIAADTPNGLVVPVFKNVDEKGLFELSAELMDKSKAARDKKLKPADMQGACFTISSLGGIGGTSFTPIVNAPEVAILGLTRSAMKPVWNGSEFVPRLMQPMSLSYDHRVIDGAEAARFVKCLGEHINDVRLLLT